MEKERSNLMSKDEILEYISKEIQFFDNDADLFCEEIGDGNINYVFRVKDRNSDKSLVIKQADTLLRSSGRPLDIYRSKIEAEVLRIEEKLHPGSVPKVFYYDEEKALIVMEDISSYKNLRTEFLNGRIYEHLQDTISEFLAKTLIPMTDFVITRNEKKENVKKFINPELCDITEDLVLTEPYYNYKNRNIITNGLEEFVEENLYTNEDLKCEVLKLKDKYQNYSQTLIHGDLHLGSIFVNDYAVKVIDPEFAFYGPVGYDVGNVWGNLFFPLAHYVVLDYDQNEISNLKRLIVNTIDNTINKFEIAFEEYVTNDFLKNKEFKNYYLNEIKNDSIGYAGTEVIRRVVGDSKVIEVMSIKDNQMRQNIDKLLILFGIDLIMNRSIYDKGEDLVKSFDKIFGEIYFKS